MTDVPLGREVDGIMSTEESVYGMLRVIGSKTIYDSGTFWTWDGKVKAVAEFSIQVFKMLTSDRSILGRGFRPMFRAKKQAEQRIGRSFEDQGKQVYSNRFEGEIPQAWVRVPSLDARQDSGLRIPHNSTYNSFPIS